MKTERGVYYGQRIDILHAVADHEYRVRYDVFRSVSFISGNETETLRRRLKRKGTSPLDIARARGFTRARHYAKVSEGREFIPTIHTPRARTHVCTSLLFILSLTD